VLSSNYMSVLNFLIGSFIGFVAAHTASGKHEGENGKLNPIIFKWKGRTFHLHHWLLSSTLLSVSLVAHVYSAFTIGILSAVAAQGLSYKDRFHVVYKERRARSRIKP